MNENQIKENIDNPARLEQLFRSDKKGFQKAFHSVYDEISAHKATEFWKARLEHEFSSAAESKCSITEILILILTCAIVCFLIQIPKIFNLPFTDDLFYQRNAGLIVLFGLSGHLVVSKKGFNIRNILISLAVFIISAVYVNFLPDKSESQSINLVYLHLPLMLWCLLGLIYINYDVKEKNKRIDYIKFNGDLAIWMALILIAGMVLTGITFGLFEAIDINIEKFYFDYIIISGLVSVPIVATYVIRCHSGLTNKLAPIIAQLFTPLVLLTLIAYLITIPIIGKDPFNDRDFLLIFNIMLLAVMALIIFSISETSAYKKQRFNEIILLSITFVALLIDLIALSAILYRLGEYGFTPNRIAVLGSNLLIFVNLLFIFLNLIQVNFRKKELVRVENTISRYLIVYALWTVIVVFFFPLIFGLK
jgi:hypothetical protein